MAACGKVSRMPIEDVRNANNYKETFTNITNFGFRFARAGDHR